MSTIDIKTYQRLERIAYFRLQCGRFGRKLRNMPEALMMPSSNETQQSHFFWDILGPTCFFGVTTAFLAFSRPFWLDELLTIRIARLDSWTEILAVLHSGIDFNPPLQYFLVNAVETLLGQGQLTARLPVVALYWLMCLSLFLYLKARLPQPYAMVGFIFPMIAGSFQHATEARPYALVLGFAGLSLVLWQRANEGEKTLMAHIAFAVCLSLALLSHCFAMFLYFPYAIAEFVRFIEIRKLNFRTIWALLLSAWPLLFYPSLLALRQNMALNPADPNHIDSINRVYGLLLEPASGTLAVCLLVTVFVCARRPKLESPRSARLKIPNWEFAALIGFGLIPALANFTTWTMNSRYFYRYGAVAIIPVTIILVYALYYLADGDQKVALYTSGLILAAFVFFMIGPIMAQLGNIALNRKGPTRATVSLDEKLEKVSLPIVVADHTNFFEMDFYSDASIARRLYFVTSPELAKEYTGYNEFEISFQRAKQSLEMRSNVVRLEDFLKDNQRFLVLSHHRPWEWVSRYLRDQGYKCLLVEIGTGWILYETQRP